MALLLGSIAYSFYGSSLRETAKLVDLATATEEQTAVVESINVYITEINTLNQEGMENLQSTLRACSDLELQAARLKQLVSSFRI